MYEVPSAAYSSKPQHVAKLLLELIIRDDMPPGSSLGTESELLEKFQVSRPTLRACLSVLESQGVLTLRPGPKGGIILTKPGIDVLSNTLLVYLRLNQIEFDEVMRTRMLIEPVMAHEAALYGTEAQFDAMEKTIEKMEAVGDEDSDLFVNENREFHSLIAQSANNPVLEVFWLTIKTLVPGNASNLRFTKRSRVAIAKSHRDILEAFRSRDADGAQKHMVEHLKSSRYARKGAGEALSYIEV